MYSVYFHYMSCILYPFITYYAFCILSLHIMHSVYTIITYYLFCILYYILSLCKYSDVSLADSRFPGQPLYYEKAEKESYKDISHLIEAV